MKNNYGHLQLWQERIGEGRLGITLTVLDTGKGVHGILTGGSEPHVGGVILALPRPSLKLSSHMSADLYITPAPGHKDVEVASHLGKILAKELQQPIVISAGIHSDNLTTEEINIIIDNSKKLCLYYLEWFRQNSKK